VLETPHVIVGAAIASKIGNPLLAIPLAIGSHFLLELVPHWNPHLNTELKTYEKLTPNTTKIIIMDAIIAGFSALFIASHALPNIGLCLTILTSGFVSILPDLIEGPYYFLKSKNKLIEKWVAIQKSIQNDAEFVPGILTQLGTIMVAMWWIFS
jgi:hypothetical protein